MSLFFFIIPTVTVIIFEMHLIFKLYTEMVDGVLVCSSCNNKIPQTGCLNNRNSFFHSLEAGRPWSRNQHGQVLVRVLFLDCRWLPSHRVLTWQVERKSKLLPLIRALTRLIRALPSWPVTSQRPYLKIPSYWGLALQHRNLRGMQTFGL